MTLLVNDDITIIEDADSEVGQEEIYNKAINLYEHLAEIFATVPDGRSITEAQKHILWNMDILYQRATSTSREVEMKSVIKMLQGKQSKRSSTHIKLWRSDIENFNLEKNIEFDDPSYMNISLGAERLRVNLKIAIIEYIKDIYKLQIPFHEFNHNLNYFFMERSMQANLPIQEA